MAIALEHWPDQAPAAARIAGERVRVRGLVQGVGFRPHAFRLATECGLAGEVWNDAEGVIVRIWGPAAARRLFLRRLRTEAPPLARIDALETLPLGGAPPQRAFRILASHAGAVRTGVAPDAATCPACLAEVRDPDDRRHRYPFTNCTDCGPRLSIVGGIPYDRARTSMAGFTMCAACQAEYDDPGDRRFHAQPNACPRCGPRLWLESAREANADPIAATRERLAAGEIVAIKGIGGFHLAVDATDADAVQRLRTRKRRYDKPFALMASDIDVVRRYCALSADEQALLTSPAAPIVILAAAGRERVAPGVAPGQRSLGVMLPYTPLHHLLLEGLERPIVLTSGNPSEEPQCTGNEAARARLSGITGHLLMHDRAILNRVDDSVVRVMDGAPRLLRRARGYAPAPLPLPDGFASAPPILAMGAELKNTFCLLQDGRATLSQHIGDLEDAATFADYRASLALYRSLLGHEPEVVALDRHPDYLSTKLGRELGLEVIAVQHHHAHIASCLAENGVPLDADPVLGVALDGLGYGEDGTIWGGEVLRADYRGFTRLAHLRPVPMLGGAQSRPRALAQRLCPDPRGSGLGAVRPRACAAGAVRRSAGPAARHDGGDAGPEPELPALELLRPAVRCRGRSARHLPRPGGLRGPGRDRAGGLDRRRSARGRGRGLPVRARARGRADRPRRRADVAGPAWRSGGGHAALGHRGALPSRLRRRDRRPPGRSAGRALRDGRVVGRGLPESHPVRAGERRAARKRLHPPQPPPRAGQRRRPRAWPGGGRRGARARNPNRS